MLLMKESVFSLKENNTILNFLCFKLSTSTKSIL